MLVANTKSNRSSLSTRNNWRWSQLVLAVNLFAYCCCVTPSGATPTTAVTTAALLTGHQLLPWQTAGSSAATTPSTARNLYAPYQSFSQQDDISFKDLRQRSDGTVVQSFGSYRTARQMGGSTAQRRSDSSANSQVEIIPAPSVELPQSELITVPKQLVPTMPENVTRQGRKDMRKSWRKRKSRRKPVSGVLHSRPFPYGNITHTHCCRPMMMVMMMMMVGQLPVKCILT